MYNLKKECLFIFDHPLALRSYRYSDEVQETLHECKVLGVYSTFDTSEIAPIFFGVPVTKLKISRAIRSSIAISAHLYWNRVRSRSLSIDGRLLRSKSNGEISKIGQIVLASISLYWPNLRLSWLISQFAFSLKRILKSFQGTNFVVIYVTVGGPTSLNDVLVKLSYKMGFKLFTILENWDNVSSKAVFNEFPDKIGLWGPQSKKFAQHIHNIDDNILELVGNPRIEWLKSNFVSSALESKIAFAGGSIDYELELSHLAAIRKILKQLELTTRIVYLPHPKFYSNCRDNLHVLVHLGIEVLNLKQVKTGTKPGVIDLPSLDTYLDFFTGAMLVLSPLSTMNIEAAILGIPTLGLDFPNKQNKNIENGFISKSHDHLSDLTSIHGLKMTKGLFEFEALLYEILSGKLSTDVFIVEKYVAEYIYKKGKNLLEIVNSLSLPNK